MNKTFVPIKEQEEIINIDNKNLIVSASAGSGKTTVMIKKIVKYILDGKCHVKDLLVLTYTKSAASEMKKKLTDKLREQIIERPEMFDELESVLNSDISTFDSFCQKLVKKYFYVLNIDPSFTILESGEQYFQQSKALNSSLEELKKINPNCYETLLINFSPKRNEDKIKELILKIYSYYTSIYNVQNFIEKTENLYNKENKVAERFLNNYYNNIFTQIKNNLIQLQIDAKKHNFLGYVEYINNLLSIIDNFILEKNFGKKIDFLSSIDYKILRVDKNDKIEFNKSISKEKSKLKLHIDNMIENFVSSDCINKSYESCYTIINALLTLFKIFIEKYSQLKMNISAFDFDDIERLTIKLLENKQINTEIKNTYKYIFVDEFQDANAIQERIIFLIQNNNLFFVGDTKQSIYAFRESDPEIFINIEKQFSNNEYSESKKLNCNFRTNKNILYFVNKIFNIIMTEKTAGISYEKNAQFDPKANYEDVNNEICVSLNYINKPHKPEKIDPTEVYNIESSKNLTNNISNFENETTFISKKIISLLDEYIYNKEICKNKKIQLSDITILISKRGLFLQSLIKKFSEIGIPYIVNTSDNLEEMFDNVVLYNLLKYSQNAKDDYALYSVMTSDLFNFTNEELSLIKFAFNNFTYFYESVEEYAKLDNELSQKIKNFFRTVSTFYFDAKYKGIYFALSNILIKTNYLLNISKEENFQNRKINIEQFIDSFCGSKYDKDLCGYINYRETTIRTNKIQSPQNFVDAVTITTMHSSKGLEYPIVIIPNLDLDFSKGQINGNEIKINKDIGLGVKAYNTNERTISSGIFYESCKLKNNAIEQSEKIRLLYVALTRAKNKLILVGQNTNNYYAYKDDLEIMSTNNFLSMITNCLPINIIERINKGDEFSANLFENNKINVNCLNITTEPLTYNKLEIVTNKNEQALDELISYMSEDLSKQNIPIALKNSVSGFSHDSTSSLNYAPKYFNINEHLSEKPNEIGTLYHKLLEKIVFNNIKSEQDIQLFIECNFSEDEISLLKQISYTNIYNNILTINELAKNSKYILKEQKFVMNIPYNEIIKDSNISEKILIQGIIDLVIIEENNIILIDYKLSSKSNEEIKIEYSKQLDLYKLALNKWFKNHKIKKFILNLKQNKLIDLNK